MWLSYIAKRFTLSSEDIILRLDLIICNVQSHKVKCKCTCVKYPVRIKLLSSYIFLNHALFDYSSTAVQLLFVVNIHINSAPFRSTKSHLPLLISSMNNHWQLLLISSKRIIMLLMVLCSAEKRAADSCSSAPRRATHSCSSAPRRITHIFSSDARRLPETAFQF